MHTRLRHIPRTRRSMAGVSLVELMVGITLGLLVLAGLASVFANTSRSRSDIDRASRQIENGRYALEVLRQDIRLGGFYAEFNPDVLPNTSTATPDSDVCSTDPTVWLKYLRSPIYGYYKGANVPTCLPGTLKSNTDLIVVRRVAGCEAGDPNGCAAAINGQPYFQASKCSSSTELGSVSITDAYRFGLYGTGGTTFDRTKKDCTAVAGLRKYLVHVYFISTDNGQGQAIPTLKRLELNPNVPNGFDEVPLVEGIEQMNIEYGIDYNLDGQPDGYTPDPATYAPSGCGGACTPALNWQNVVSVRFNLLSRNLDVTPNYTDKKTYTLGLDKLGNPITYTPNDGYQRHAYNSVVRVENVSQRRDLP